MLFGLSVNGSEPLTILPIPPPSQVVVYAGTNISNDWSATQTFPGVTVTGFAGGRCLQTNVSTKLIEEASAGCGISGGVVTSVTGTPPITSSGGTTPAIGCNVASALQAGCLSSTDFSTFSTGVTNAAPKAATYILQTADANLTNAQALGSLGTGLVLNTSGTGVLSIFAGHSCSVGQGLTALDASGAFTCDTFGSVTSVSTTSPITGGPITTTGTVACATCVTSAASLTSGQLMTGAGGQGSQVSNLSGDVTTSGSAATTLAAKYKVRTCLITVGDPGAGSAPLSDDNDSPAQCGNDTGVDETITAVACWADAGSPTVTPITTGGGATSILSSALTCGTASWAAGTLNGTPVLHSFSANGATCSSTPCTLDGNITTAGGTAKYLIIKVTMTL